MTNADKGACAIALEGVHKRFGDVVPVRDLDLTIEDGEFFSLIGPSGCGKTTTLRMIAGHEQPTSGVIRVHGRDVTGMPPYKRPVQTVFQNYALFPHLNVYRNVAFGLEEQKRPKREIHERVSEMLEVVHLGARESAMPAELSGGQQQRVALARALVLKPEVLVLDEPLGALDLKLRRQMQAMLRTIQREVGITFVYVTHDQEEAFSMSSRVAVMNAGELEQVGTPREIYHKPASQFVADFAGASNMIPVTVVGVREGHRYRAMITESGRELEVDGPAGLRVGSSASLVLRPESFELVSGGADGIAGTVIDTSYNGPHNVVVVRTAEAGDLTVATRDDGVSGIERGSSVALRWPPHNPWLVNATTLVERGDKVADVEASSLEAELAADAAVRP